MYSCTVYIQCNVCLVPTELNGLDIEAEHCMTEYVEDKVYLTPLSGTTIINTSTATSQTKLTHGEIVRWTDNVMSIYTFLPEITHIHMLLESYINMYIQNVAGTLVIIYPQAPSLIPLLYLGDIVQLGSTCVFRFNHPREAEEMKHCSDEVITQVFEVVQCVIMDKKKLVTPLMYITM